MCFVRHTGRTPRLGSPHIPVHAGQAVWLVLPTAVALGIACGDGTGESGGALTLTVTPVSLALSDCASAQLVVSLTDANGSAVPGATYSFASTADSVATVSTAGLVAAQGQGAATIVVGSRGRLVNVPVSVTASPLSLGGVPDSLILYPTLAETLSVAVVDCHGDGVPSGPITYSSTNAAVASATGAGIISGNAYGTATITVEVAGFTATFDAVVIGRPLGELLTPLPIAFRPFGVAVSGAGVGYVTQLDAGAVTRFSLATLGAVATVSVGSVPTDVAFGGDGAFAFVSNQLDLSVGRIVVSSGTEADTATVGGNTFRVRLSPDGSRVYVTTNVAKVYIFEEATFVLVDSAAVGIDPNGIAFHPDGTRWYSSNRSGSVSEVSATTNQLLRTFAVGGQPQDILVSPDGNELYVANELIGLQVWSIPNNSHITTIPVTNPFAMEATPDSTQLYVTGFLGGIGRVHVIDRAGRAIVRSHPVGGVPRRIAFNRLGSRAVVANEAGWVDFIR